MPTEPDGALGPYLRALRAHRLAVVAALLACLLGAFAWLTLRTPDYRTDAEILVTPLPEGDETFIGIPFIVSSGGDQTRTVQTAATLVSSTAAAEETARRIGGGLTSTDVSEAVTVEPKGESNVLSVEATATSPGLARSLANTFATSSLELRSEQLRRQIEMTITRLRASQQETRDAGRPEAAAELATRLAALEGVRDGNDPTLSISERAAEPRKPIGAPAWLVLALATFAGIALGLGLALLLELADRRVRDEDELLSLYPVPVLARVPLVSRRSLRRAPNGMPPPVREAYRTLQAQLEVRGESNRMVMVTSASRNDGKTTSAINLAISLATAGRSVVLLDFDLRKPDIARRLGIADIRGGLEHLVQPGAALEDVLVPAPGLPLLQVGGAEGAASDVARLERLLQALPRILAACARVADYVVVDTAPLGEVSDALKIAEEVDDVVFVARPGRTNRVNLLEAREILERAERAPTGLLIMGGRRGADGYYGYETPKSRQGPLARLTAR
jgi:capsular exopolysaccharide synthesis family protein